MNLERLREDVVHAEPDGGAHEVMLLEHLRAMIHAIPADVAYRVGIMDTWEAATDAVAAYRLGQIRYEEAR